MRRLFVLAALAALATAFVAGATGVAAAQTADVSTDANGTNATVDVGGDQEYLQELDSETRITGWRYDRDTSTMYVEVETDARKTITMTEHVQATKGVSSGSIRQHRVPEGSSTVSIEAEPVAGEAAVALTTPESIREGNYVVVSTGKPSISWFDGSASWDLVYVGVLVAFGGAFWGTWRYLRKRESKRKARVAEVIR